MQNLQKLWYKLNTDIGSLQSTHTCSFLYMWSKPFLTHEVFYFSLWNITTLYPKLSCNWIPCVFFSTLKTTKNALRNVLVVSEKLQFNLLLAHSLTLLRNPVLFGGENSLGCRRGKFQILAAYWGLRERVDERDHLFRT